MKTITKIESFEKVGSEGRGVIYEKKLVCGCRERSGYFDLEPEVGGWAECSQGIVDNYTTQFCPDAERAELKRALHDASNPSMQIALAALLYAYRYQKHRNDEFIQRSRRTPPRPPYPRPPMRPPYRG